MLQRTIKVLSHPVAIFIILQVIWVAVLVLWVTGFLSQRHTLEKLSSQIGHSGQSTPFELFVLIIGCVLLGLILIGVVMLFVFTQKQASFLKQQRSFVSSVTHELKSPLASLKLSFETLQKPSLPKEVETRVNEMIQHDLSRLLTLVDRLLLTAQLDRGVAVVEKTPERINLREFTLLTAQQCSHYDQDIFNRLSLICQKDLMLTLPKTAFGLVLGNLIENAIKYSPKETPIVVKLEQEGKKLHLMVKDQGFGLSSRDAKRIFRMFYRADIARQKAVKGTGIGLFIVKSMVKLMGGEIRVISSGPNQGTTFDVRLPLKGEQA